jgi:hypothetical protein
MARIIAKSCHPCSGGFVASVAIAHRRHQQEIGLKGCSPGAGMAPGIRVARYRGGQFGVFTCKF